MGDIKTLKIAQVSFWLNFLRFLVLVFDLPDECAIHS